MHGRAHAGAAQGHGEAADGLMYNDIAELVAAYNKRVPLPEEEAPPGEVQARVIQ